ncbi:hypothetical protein BDN72DRAFT_822379 [Pluteus cervinus]|uniref:Uncharacterized protein n=1 Tax=Pluteus cervinus TaxID=181527 RepID=A0ACD3ANB7_9AGAR|nr:hypothetical protein BDN72DRAFT_822379 [Pluteus cervinus]
MNSTSECGFSSLNSVLKQAAADNANITELVQGCQTICNLVWGTGNPDLSGVGANISYIMQFAFIVVFGPVFILTYGMREKWGLREKVVANIEKLHDTFIDSSAQLTIPVSVATVVRIKQDAPLYEIAFLQSLTTMQFLGLLAVIIASGVTERRKDEKRILLLVLYGLMDFGFYMGLIGFLRTSQASWTHIRELGTVCEGYGTIIPGFTYAKGAHFPQIDAFSSPASLFQKNGWIAIGLLLAAMFGLLLGGWILWKVFLALISKKPVPLGIISAGLTFGTLYCLVQMERTRNVMKALTGPEFQDNQWGFGQVVSLFLWAPLLIQGMWYFFARILDRGSEDISAAATKDVEGVENGPQAPDSSVETLTVVG